MTMIKFQHREFNEEHARAGALYCHKNGDATQINKFDGRSEYKFMGVQSNAQHDFPMSWSASSLAMLPLGYTDDGKPVWTGDLIIAPGYCDAFAAHAMQRDFSGFTWPVAVAAKVYPETLASPDLLSTAYSGPQKDGMGSGFSRSLQAVANAAIRHAIDAGQVILPADTKRADAALCKTENLLEALGWRLMDGEWYNAYSRHFYGEIGGIHMTGEKADIKAVADLCAMRDAIPAREMAIAIAVEQVFINARYSIPGEDGIDLAAILASVKP